MRDAANDYKVYRLADTDTSPTWLDTPRLCALGARRVLPLPEMATTTNGQSSRPCRHHALRSQLGSGPLLATWESLQPTEILR